MNSFLLSLMIICWLAKDLGMIYEDFPKNRYQLTVENTNNHQIIDKYNP